MLELNISEECLHNNFPLKKFAVNVTSIDK